MARARKRSITFGEAVPGRNAKARGKVGQAAPARRPQTAPSKAKVRLILAAAKTILEREGTDALTVERIAAEAQCAKSSVSVYFRDNSRSGAVSAICAAIATETSAGYLAFLEAALSNAEGAAIEDAVQTVIEAMIVEMARAPRLHAGVLAWLSPRSRRRIYERYLARHVQLFGAFLADRRDQVTPPVDLAAWVLVHAADGVGQAIAREPTRFRVDALKQNLVRLALRYLGVGKSEQPDEAPHSPSLTAS